MERIQLGNCAKIDKTVFSSIHVRHSLTFLWKKLSSHSYNDNNNQLYLLRVTHNSLALTRKHKVIEQ